MVFWDLATGKMIQKIDKPSWSPVCGAFSPDGRLFAVASFESDIVVFDTATGNEQRRIHSHRITLSLAFSPDSKRLAAGDSDGCICFWDASTGNLIAPTPDPALLPYRLRFEPDGESVLGFSQDGVHWWDVRSGTQLRHACGDAACDMLIALSPDEKLFAAKMPGRSLALLDTATGTVLRRLVGHKGAVYNVAFSPDGTKLFSAGGMVDPRIIVWDVKTGKPRGDFQCPMLRVDRVSVSPDGRWLASCGIDPWARDDDVRLWDVEKRKLVRRLKPRNGSVVDMAFSLDSRRLVTAGGIARMFNVHADIQLWDVASGKELRACFGHKDPVISVSITPDCRMIASGANDKSLRLWEVASGLERRRLVGHDGYVQSLDFSSDGRSLASTSNDVPAFIWDTYSTELLHQPKLAGETDDRLWERLADIDATMAFDAVCVLLTRADAVVTLRQHWNARPRATAAQMQHWLKDLNAKEFVARTHAADNLERFAPGHESLLRQADERTTSTEVRQHLNELLTRNNPERLRRTRMLEVLEHVKTASAREFLQELAADKEDATLARDATESLKRLAQP